MDAPSIVSHFLWKYSGRVLDTVVSGASGLREKNFSRGWGDMVPILDYSLNVMEQKILPSVPEIKWQGEWKEVDGIPASSQLVFSPFKLVLGIMSLIKRFVSGPEDPIKYPKLLIRDASFVSPVAHLLPEGSKDVHFRVVLPLTEESANQPADGISWSGKMAVHFAATGDEGFSVRQAWYAAPLAMQHGIASIIPIQALYGKRRPTTEKIVSTAYASVAQVALMGTATIEEGTSLVRWLVAGAHEGGVKLEKKVCLTGVSLGGSMTACVAARSQAELASAPIMAAFSPAAVFKKNGGGVMGQSVAWGKLVGSAPALPPTFQARLSSSVSLTPQTEDEASDLVEEILLNSASLDMLPAVRRPDCTVCVTATDDLYIPEYASQHTASTVGAACTTIEVGGGHATGFLLHHQRFRAAVVQALEKLGREDCSSK